MKKILGIGVILIMSLNMVFVSATNQSDLDKIKQETAAKEKEAASIQKSIDSYLTEIDTLSDQIDNEETELSKIQKQISKYDSQIAEQERALQLADTQYNGQDELLKARLRTIYENGTTSFWDVVMSSKNVSEFLSKYYVVTQMVEYDQQIMSNINNQKDYIDNIKVNLEANKKAREDALKSQKTKVKSLEVTKAAKDKALKDMQSDKAGIEDLIKKNAAEAKALEAKIAAALKASGGSSTGSGHINGGYMWPVPASNRVNSGFGYRTDPITGETSYHDAIDIGAPTGTPIVATAAGTVIIATFGTPGSGYGGYGNVTVIDHGNGVITRYAHQNSIAVSAGQTVSQGQVIGYVGSTGRSTGSHLDFAIIINGVNKNPLSYVSYN